MALWKPTTRQEKLDFFASLTDEQLERAWYDYRDRYLPETREGNHVCRGCRHNVSGIGCVAPESLGVISYKDCERAVAENPTVAWAARIKDPFIEEGVADYNAGDSLDECPYDEGTDGQTGWLKGWREAEARDKENAYGKL